MKMRKMLALGLVLTLALTGSVFFTSCGNGTEEPVDGGETEVTEWSFYSPYGPEDSACSFIWADLFKQIETETDGRLVITPYWSGQHPYEGSDMLKVVKDGTAELSHFYSGYVASVEPALTVDGLPLLFPTDPMKAWEINKAMWGDFTQNTEGPLEKILQEKWNASMIHMIPATSQRLMTTGYASDGLDSLKGHKIRVYSSELSKFVELLGGTPVSLSSSEVVTSLSQNLIDGLVTSVVFAYQLGFFDYVDTINLWEISQSSDGMMVNLDALNALPEDVRETFLRIMQESAMKPEMKELDDNNAKVEELVNAGTATVVEVKAADRAAIAEMLEEEIWQPWAENLGQEGQDIIDFVKSYN